MRTKDDLKSHLEIINRARHTGKCLATPAKGEQKENSNPAILRRSPMPKSPFDKTHLAAWNNALKNNKPEPIELVDVIGSPQVESMDVAVDPAALAVRMATRGGETVDLLFNPVAARELMLSIANAGKQMGWFDDKLNIIDPDWFFDA